MHFTFSWRSVPLWMALFVLLAAQLACGASLQGAVGSAQATALPKSATALPAIPERRMLTLEFPATIRAGDSDVVRLTLEVDDLGNLTPTAELNGNITRGEVIEIPSLYDTHYVLAEARLDMAGVTVRPEASITETLQPGQKVTFYWSVQPQDVGHFRGTVWFYLRFAPKAGGEPEQRMALSAQVIELDSVSLLGLGANTVRWLGVAGTGISWVLGLPFLEDVLKRVWRKKPTAGSSVS